LAKQKKALPSERKTLARSAKGRDVNKYLPRLLEVKP